MNKETLLLKYEVNIFNNKFVTDTLKSKISDYSGLEAFILLLFFLFEDNDD